MSEKYEYKTAVAVLSYFLIGLIWYLIDEKAKQDNFVKYHVKQGLVLLIFAIIWSIALSIVNIILFWLLPLQFLVYFLNLVPLVLAILGLINAVNNKEVELPMIGQFAKKFTF